MDQRDRIRKFEREQEENKTLKILKGYQPWVGSNLRSLKKKTRRYS